jgi:hypothetical protein
MKTTMTVFAALLFCAPVMAQQVRKPCEELKSEIDAKLQAKGVQNYTLEIVPAADVGDGKVVGSCNGGQDRIVYTRGGKTEK